MSFSYEVTETITFNLYILYTLLPGSCEYKDSRVARSLMVSRRVFCEPLHTHPKKKKMILLAIRSNVQLQMISLS